jgi:hypothetical protein
MNIAVVLIVVLIIPILGGMIMAGFIEPLEDESHDPH